VLANDASAGPLIAPYLSTKLRARRVAVLADSSAYGKTFARSARVALGRRVVLTGSVRAGQRNFSGLVRQIRAKKPTVVVFGGYYDQGGPLAKQLFGAGWKGAFVGGDGLMDPAFTRAAGSRAAARSFIVAGVAPATLSSSFTQAYEAAYASAPGPYALEAYDAANVLLAAIGAGSGTRSSVLGAVDHYDGTGLTKRIRFSRAGETLAAPVWVYRPTASGFTVRTRLP
jgi:branched-chain amino acid transport system substrate-binding protein